MKIIISHDVDHLFREDHYKDLIYPKLWVRESLKFIRGKINPRQWLGRMMSPFRKERHNLAAIMKYDRELCIPSTFFFGMANGLGMSYNREKAYNIIKNVISSGFDVGVHGIAFSDLEKMKEEFALFRNMRFIDSFGIREHYVRFDDTTFEKMSDVGYLFDSTEFDKEKGYLIKAPYKAGHMWEFPLTVMDGYLPDNTACAKIKTIEILKEAHEADLRYFTILFHDYLFCDAYASYRDWYIWLTRYLAADKQYEFISYRDAIKELELSK